MGGSRPRRLKSSRSSNASICRPDAVAVVVAVVVSAVVVVPSKK